MKSTDILRTALFTALMALCAMPAAAQNAIQIPDTLRGTQSSWLWALNGSQASYHNWSKGGVGTISVTGSTLLRVLSREEGLSYGILFSAVYGRARIQGDGNRKTEDKVQFRSRILYDIPRSKGRSRVFGDVHALTQFDDGFQYGKNPEDPDVLISGWLSPAYFTQTMGFLHAPSKQFSVEAGIGLKQTLVTESSIATRYGLSSDETWRKEGGVTLGVTLKQTLMKNVTYDMVAESFTSLQSNLEDTDVTVTNRIVGKINSHLNVTFKLDMLYDRDFSTELQFSQVLMAGLSVTI